MWESLLLPKKKTPHATVIILGSPAIQKFQNAFDSADNNQLMAYHRQAYISESGEVKSILDIYQLTHFSPEVVLNIKYDGVGLVIYSFDWFHTEMWPSISQQLGQIYKERPSKLLLTCHNFEAAIEENVTATLGKEYDNCQQFLRTQALKLNGSLVYSALDDQWIAVLAHILGVECGGSVIEPAEKWVGVPTVIYGGDSKQKIMAINPQFDFDAAWDYTIELSALTHSKEISKYRPNLPNMLGKLIKDQKSDRSSRPFRAVLDGADEHKVMSEFFNQLAEKST